jgi:hypothetical protein
MRTGQTTVLYFRVTATYSEDQKYGCVARLFRVTSDNDGWYVNADYRCSRTYRRCTPRMVIRGLLAECACTATAIERFRWSGIPNTVRKRDIIKIGYGKMKQSSFKKGGAKPRPWLATPSRKAVC